MKPTRNIMVLADRAMAWNTVYAFILEHLT